MRIVHVLVGCSAAACCSIEMQIGRQIAMGHGGELARLRKGSWRVRQVDMSESFYAAALDRIGNIDIGTGAAESPGDSRGASKKASPLASSGGEGIDLPPILPRGVSVSVLRCDPGVSQYVTSANGKNRDYIVILGREAGWRLFR